VSSFSAGTSRLVGPLPTSRPPPPGFAPRAPLQAPSPVPAASPAPAAPPVPPPPPPPTPQAPVAGPQVPSARLVPAPPQAPAALGFAKPPIVHVYSKRAPTPTLTPAPPAGAPPRRSSIVPSPPRYVKTDPPVPAGAVPIPPVDNSHNMATRGKSGYRQPRLTLHAEALSPLPRSVRDALADPNWRRAMEEEHTALLENHTWDLVPRPAHANIVTGKWIFKYKFHADGSLDRYKARWVLRGFTQRPGVDYDETFSPVVKPTTVRTVLTLAHSRDWPIHQLDVKNAFLHGTLSETVYCSQPVGFTDSALPDHVCRLNKSLYGLKQAPMHGTAGLPPICSLWGSLKLRQIPLCSYFTAALRWFTCSCMWMTSSSLPRPSRSCTV
jgi:hypothetical protein